MITKTLSRAAAATIVAALILTSPGLPFYQALAAGIAETAPVNTAPGYGAMPVVTPGLSDGSLNVNGNQGFAAGLLNRKSITGILPVQSVPQTAGSAVSGLQSDAKSPTVSSFRRMTESSAKALSSSRLLASAAIPLAAPGANPVLAAQWGAPIAIKGLPAANGVGGRISNVEKVAQVAGRQEAAISKKVEQLKRYFGDKQTGVQNGVAAVSQGSRAATDKREESLGSSFSKDKDYQAGLESARNWQPGAQIDSPAPDFWSRHTPWLKARAAERVQNFHRGIADGIAERTGFTEDAALYFNLLKTGISTEKVLATLLNAAPSNGPPVPQAGTVTAAKTDEKPGAPRDPAPQPKKNNSIWWFLGGLLVAQVGIESLGIAMPLLMRERFGGFSAMAKIAVFSSIGSMFGRLVGGAVSDKFGLKTTYVVTTIIRLLSISALIMFLIGPGLLPALAAKTGLAFLAALATWLAPVYAADPFLVLTFFYSFNAFVGGISMTAEMTIPQAMLGQQRSVLERFFALQQWLVETIGVTGPKIGGTVVSNYGFIPALLIYPVTFVVAIALFIIGIKIPAKPEGVQAAPAEQTQAEAPKPPVQKQPGFFKRIGAGAAIIFKSPVMRTAFFGYTAYVILNVFLYSIVGPAYGLLVGGGDSGLAANVGSYITSLYSLGGLFGGIIMWRESSIINAAKENPAAVQAAADLFKKDKATVQEVAGEKKSIFNVFKKAGAWIVRVMDAVVLKAYLGKWIGGVAKDGKISDEGEKELLKKSTLLWMLLGMIGLSAFATMLLTWPIPAYVAMIPFGIAQVICTLKLRTIVMSEAPEAARTSVNGFFGAASIAVFAVGQNMMGKLFDAFTGVTPFLYFDLGLVFLAATCFYLMRTLKRHTEAPGTKPNFFMKVMGIAMGVVYGGVAAGVVYKLGAALFGLVLKYWPLVQGKLAALLSMIS